MFDYTSVFEPIDIMENDFRYKITPKKESCFAVKEYNQVFDNGQGFVPGMSIIDLVFNMGPEAVNFL